ncbi:MAG: ATP-binding protein [Candidatus Dormibacteraceae bacterium]
MSDAIVRTLGLQPMLLVLDNCEQVLAACRELVRKLLGSNLDLKVIATSRQPLGLPGELVWPVPSLTTPPTVVGVADLASYESVQLFVDRVALAGGGFQITERNAAAVAEICSRLDGMPLAIELAAAWVLTLGVEGIRERLADRLDLLTDSPHASAQRHRSLRSTLDWSRGLLAPREQALWRRLAIFAPQFDLGAIEEICSDTHIPRREIPGLQRSLLERSLVQVQTGGDQVARYRLLETVREYCLENLRAAGELDTIAAAHARYYVSLAEEAFGHRDRADLVSWAERMTTEHANVRTALDWLRGHDRGTELQLAGAMAWVWGARELLPEGSRLLGRALDQSTSSSRFGARAHRAAGMLALEQADTRAARRHLEHAVRLYEALQDEAGQAICLARLGAFEDSGSGVHRRATLERAADLAERTGEGSALVVALANLGALDLERGSGRSAIQRYERAVALCREIGHARWLPQMLEGLAQAQLAEEKVAAATASIAEAIALVDRAKLPALVPTLLETMAEVTVARAAPERALRLAGAAAGIRKATGAGIPHDWPANLARAVGKARRSLPGAGDALWADGFRMTSTDAIAFALSDDRGVALPASATPISQRQAEVAGLVAEGLTNAQIAARLSISERTAEWHVEELRNRLGFSSRAQVAAWAVRQGLAPSETKG